MRIAALVKQIPKFESMTLTTDGRLQRDGVELEMNAYCRRAVAQAVLFAQADATVEITVITLGPATADDCLREAIAWGDAHGVTNMSGVHICDPAFAGSDTLATSRTIAAAISALGGFDLVVCGRNAVDADTGQVGPQLAQLLGANFVSAARTLGWRDPNQSPRGVHAVGRRLHARSETDDGYVELNVSLPAVVSCAERLCDPCKVDPAGRAAVAPDRIQRFSAADLGEGPWGATASPTWVGAVRSIESTRAAQRWPELSIDEQVQRAITYCREHLLLPGAAGGQPQLVGATLRAPVDAATATPSVVVIAEPDRPHVTLELLGAATTIARTTITGTTITGTTIAGTTSNRGSVVVIGATAAIPDDAGAYGADIAIELGALDLEVSVAEAVASWCTTHRPEFVIAPSTAWGREVAARVGAILGCGLTGDAIALERVAPAIGGVSPQASHPVVAWKPAFGGAMIVAIHCATDVAMATVRPGVLTTPQPRSFRAPRLRYDIAADVSDRVHIVQRTRDDNLDALTAARVVVAIGRGVDPANYDELGALLNTFDAELAATRKVTDNGWLPRARQLGITGRYVSPDLLITIGAHGKFNHSVGFRNARHVIAINTDRDAMAFDVADIGIVGDWREVVPKFVAGLRVTR